MSSPDGRSPRSPGCGIPSTSLKGYHDVPEAELDEARCGRVEGCPPGRRAVGQRQVDEMPHDSQHEGKINGAVSLAVSL